MAIPADAALYAQVKRLAAKKFDSKSGIYRSSWIVREYKKRGGRYRGSVPRLSGLRRWYKEKWVDLNRPVKNIQGKVVGYMPCGRADSHNTAGKYPMCRPTHVVSRKTPTTYKELSQEEISLAKRRKNKVRGTANIQFAGGPRKHKAYVPIPTIVRRWARYALRMFEAGCLVAEEDLERVRMLATHDVVRLNELRKMRNWFGQNYETVHPMFKKWMSSGRPKDFVSRNQVEVCSWMSWGGNAGFNWVNSRTSIMLLNRHFKTNYKTIQL